MTIGYDKYPLNHSMLLDLPFREGTGAITKDVAKPHHPVTLVNTPTWTALASGLGVIILDGVSEYLQSLAANTVDLDFTSGDYSIACWINWAAGDPSQIIMGRYQLDNDGWEIYFFDPDMTLTLRHHHAGGAAVRSACWSAGWVQNTPHLMGISRTGGGNAIHYRDGVPLTTTGDLEDPESNNNDLVIGARFTKDANFFKNMLWHPRATNRLVEEQEWLELFHRERHWLGV